ncbi:MAG: MBL fold metallo-hydrolase RNA specificity domain-containing protein, partial [bacterium]
ADDARVATGRLRHEEKIDKATLHDITGGRGTVTLAEVMQNKSKAIWLGREYLLKIFFRNKALDAGVTKNGYPFEDLRLIWSMWKTYRDRSDLGEWARKRGLEWQDIHASGHAYPSELATLVDTMKPKAVVPIHTEYPDDYGQFGVNVRRFANGVRWPV